MQFMEMFMVGFFYGKRSLEQMEHLAKQEKVIGDGKFWGYQRSYAPKNFHSITSSMAFISGLLLLNFRAIYGRRFQVISTHFNLIKLHKLANITTA